MLRLEYWRPQSQSGTNAYLVAGDAWRGCSSLCALLPDIRLHQGHAPSTHRNYDIDAPKQLCTVDFQLQRCYSLQQYFFSFLLLLLHFANQLFFYKINLHFSAFHSYASSLIGSRCAELFDIHSMLFTQPWKGTNSKWFPYLLLYHSAFRVQRCMIWKMPPLKVRVVHMWNLSFHCFTVLKTSC